MTLVALCRDNPENVHEVRGLCLAWGNIGPDGVARFLPAHNEGLAVCMISLSEKPDTILKRALFVMPMNVQLGQMSRAHFGLPKGTEQ